MRKLIVSTIVSIDGFHVGSEGPGQLPISTQEDADAFDAYNVERLRSADTLLLGATTFGMFEGFWPAVADDPEAGEAPREISRLDNAIAKVVVSDSLTPDQLDAWADTTTIVPRTEVRRAVEDLKQQDGGDILVFGSSTMWNGLLVEGLVDEVHLMVGPVVLGGGSPAFTASRALELSTTRRLDDSGVVLHVYTA